MSSSHGSTRHKQAETPTGVRERLTALALTRQVENYKEALRIKNVSMEVGKDDVLTIKVNLKKTFGASGSGKSIIIASTEGNASLEGEHSEIKVGLNVYKKA